MRFTFFFGSYRLCNSPSFSPKTKTRMIKQCKHSTDLCWISSSIPIVVVYKCARIHYNFECTFNAMSFLQYHFCTSPLSAQIRVFFFQKEKENMIVCVVWMLRFLDFNRIR